MRSNSCCLLLPTKTSSTERECYEGNLICRQQAATAFEFLLRKCGTVSRLPSHLSKALQQKIWPSYLTNQEWQVFSSYFDGATMKGCQLPHRTFEDSYCRQQDKPEECNYKPFLHGEFNISSVDGPVFGV